MCSSGVTNVAGEPDIVVLTWDDIDKTVTGLAARVAADQMPEVLVAVVRGGLIGAVLLSHRLGVRPVRAVEVTHTVDDSVRATKSAVPTVVNAASLGDLAGLDVLIVDDIAGSGDTLDRAVQLVQAAGAAKVRTAVLTVNRANWRQPNDPADAVTYVGDIVDGWVIFPWEAAA